MEPNIESSKSMARQLAPGLFVPNQQKMVTPAPFASVAWQQKGLLHTSFRPVQWKLAPFRASNPKIKMLRSWYKWAEI